MSEFDTYTTWPGENRAFLASNVTGGPVSTSSVKDKAPNEGEKSSTIGRAVVWRSFHNKHPDERERLGFECGHKSWPGG